MLQVYEINIDREDFDILCDILGILNRRFCNAYPSFLYVSPHLSRVLNRYEIEHNKCNKLSETQFFYGVEAELVLYLRTKKLNQLFINEQNI
jgi:hypothetical protein